MVYCGKPSKGCGACRARKVKCDQTTPACKRCLRNNRVCPGYRDQLSLLFRDETVAVAQKVASLKSTSSNTDSNYNSPGASSTFTADASSTEYDSIISSDTLFVDGYYNADHTLRYDDWIRPISLAPLAINRREQAISFCVNNFVWFHHGLENGNIDADLSPSAPFAQRAMMKGIVSVGMANLSRIGSVSEPMKIAAQHEYSKALQLTNAALSDPSQADNDATLTAILCLSLFEVLTSRKPENIDGFVKHAKGAVALLELRGAKRLESLKALQTFNFLRNEIIVGCLMRYYPIPPSLLALSEKTTKIPGAPYSSTVSHQISVFMSKINTLQIDDLKSQRASLDTDLLSRAFAMDSELQAVINQLPQEFSPRVYTSDPDQYFGTGNSRLYPLNGLYHRYENFTIGIVMNYFRCCRLLVHEVVFNRLRGMTTRRDFVPSAEFKNSCSQLQDMSRGLALDICATIPYMLGLIDGPNAHGHPVNTAGGLALLFPLYHAASVDGYGSATCHWAANCLNMIGREVGIDQALALVEILPAERGMTKFIDVL